MEDEGKGILSQAERSFFALRYTVPGFTFILISLLVSYPILKDILLAEANVSLAAAFLAFFSLLGGGAIGFVVSQIWYVFDYWFLYGRYSKYRELRRKVKKEYEKEQEEQHIGSGRFDQVLFLNNLFHKFSDERTQYYAQRRYDLYHTCGSTLSATVSGYIFGLVIRTRFFKMYALASCYDQTVLVMSVLLSVTLAFSLWNAAREHARIVSVAMEEIINAHHCP
jgi:hypothetical protein